MTLIEVSATTESPGARIDTFDGLPRVVEHGYGAALRPLRRRASAFRHNSLIVEKTLVDRSQKDERFLQFFPSSELTRAWTNPGTAPTFTHGTIADGGN